MTRHADIPTPPATTPALHVLAISGSTRAGSLNAQLLRAAAAALPPGVELVELDPAVIKAIPAFDEDDEARAGGDDIPALRTMRHQIAGVDAVLFATPEYNASVPSRPRASMPGRSNCGTNTSPTARPSRACARARVTDRRLGDISAGLIEQAAMDPPRGGCPVARRP